MTGISEADMNRINEFIKRNKFDRSPDQLCPDEEESPDGDGDEGRRRRVANVNADQ